MISIKRAESEHNSILSGIAEQTFKESHGNSASKQDIDHYVAEKYNTDVFSEQLKDLKNNYHLIYSGNQPVGYSNIVYNSPYGKSEIENIAKLERIYILKEFYDSKLGFELFQFNLKVASENDQKGIWLCVWTENQRAIKFYQRNQFRIVGRYDFRISSTHSNPNHIMFLKI